MSKRKQNFNDTPDYYDYQEDENELKAIKEKTFFDYAYNKSEISKPSFKKLEWIVIIEDWNAKKMQPYNVFDHERFKEGVLEAADDALSIQDFAEDVRHTLHYYFGSKCEWEFVATSWPPYIDNEEIDRLEEVRKEHIEKWSHFYRTDVRLTISNKIDVYTQICLNWNVFINYVWTALKGE